MKVRTPKYIVYETGKVYLNDSSGAFLRNLTDGQRDFVNGRHYVTRTNLEKLIEGGDEAFNKAIDELGDKKKDVMKAMGYEEVDSVIFNCNHHYNLLEKESEGYLFFCKNCLCLKRISK